MNPLNCCLDGPICTGQMKNYSYTQSAYVQDWNFPNPVSRLACKWFLCIIDARRWWLMLLTFFQINSELVLWSAHFSFIRMFVIEFPLHAFGSLQIFEDGFCVSISSATFHTLRKRFIFLHLTFFRDLRLCVLWCSMADEWLIKWRTKTCCSCVANVTVTLDAMMHNTCLLA